MYYVRKGKFMIKFDLKFGYYYVDIYFEFQKYLGFSWESEGKNRYFEFIVLFFGFFLVGYIFIKIVRVLVKYWRFYCILVVVYLDDGWVCFDYNLCIEIVSFL